MLKVLHTELEAGLDHPVKILQMTDAHMMEADEEDGQELHERLRDRHRVFYEEGGHPDCTPNEFLEQAIRYGEENGCVLVMTGDMEDLNTAGNRKELHRIIRGHDVMFTPGGHEFQKRFRRTMEEEYPYAESVRPLVEQYFPEFDLTFDSRIVGGLNLIAMDNSLDYFSREAGRRLRAEAEKGLPMLLFMHDPLDDPILTCAEPKHPNVRLTEEDYGASLDTIDFIVNCPQIVAVISGHEHLNDDRLYRGKRLIVTHGIFAGFCRQITVR